MGSNSSFPLTYQISILWLLLVLCFMAKVEGLNNKNKISGFYVFGDSTVDPGNNNYIKTAFRGNFAPYGRDFPNQVPTGRFCNGKLTADFIASYLGLKKKGTLPPYLDPNLSIGELVTGVSFASAGSGFDPLTPSIGNVIPIAKQVEHFKELKSRLEAAMGKEATENHIEKAVFLISAGTNDFIINYFALPIRRKSYTLLAYQHFLIHQVKEFIQDLLEKGAKKIAIVGLPPMGCLPFTITLYSHTAFLQRSCLDQYSSPARDYNRLLQLQLHSMQSQFNFSNSSAKLSYLDIYGPLADMIHSPQKFGYDEVDSGCCGSGYIEISYLCNKVSDVCYDRSKYVFWDSVHPTEKAYHDLFLAILPTIDFLIKS